MPTSPLKLVIRRLRVATERNGAGTTDGELLTRFLSHRDNDALTTLVLRHAPMVWGVCRRLLRSPHDAEDAFQATFLVLVRKAATVMPREMVGNWLYGVAHQTAVRLRATVAKRGVREMQMMEMPEPVFAEARANELLLLLDQELSCLPKKYRVLIVLCDLESKTRIEVARQLGIPEGTVASRLARARGMLAKRLARHGLAVSGGSLAVALSQTVASAGVPTSVVSSTINVMTLVAAGKTVTGLVSAKVATLTEGALKAMVISKLKAVIAVVLVLGFVVTGAMVLACRTAAAQDKQPAAEERVVTLQKQEWEGFTAWGKEIGGLQAGLGYLPGQKRAYSHGETVTLVVRVRNVGNEDVRFRYLKEFFMEKPPTVTGGEAKTIRLGGVILFGRLVHIPVEVNLARGKEMELHDLRLKLEPASEGGDVTEVSPEALHGKGKFQIQYELLAAASIDPNLTKLATGKLELEVKEAEKPPLTALPKPKVEKKKVYTPDEMMLEQEKARGKAIDGSKANTLTVEFKVQAVTKPTEIKLTTEKDSPYVVGHGPDDMCLHHRPPRKFEEKQFTAILTSKVVKQLQVVGIQDVGKHFMGKTIRVSGRINQHNYSGDDPPIEPHYDLVIEDVSQLETVD